MGLALAAVTRLIGQEAEVAEQGLVVDAAECGVVDDALGAGDEGCEAGEAVHGGAGFAAGVWGPIRRRG